MRAKPTEDKSQNLMWNKTLKNEIILIPSLVITTHKSSVVWTASTGLDTLPSLSKRASDWATDGGSSLRSGLKCQSDLWFDVAVLDAPIHHVPEVLVWIQVWGMAGPVNSIQAVIILEHSSLKHSSHLGMTHASSGNSQDLDQPVIPFLAHQCAKGTRA